MMSKEGLKHWTKGILFSLIIFFLLLLYLFLRRGYVNLYILNKAFASSAAIVAGVTLLIGPLSRQFNILHGYMTIRRQIGLSAFGFAILHVFFSLFLQNRFPLFDWYLKELVPVVFGILAISIWIYMAYISRNSKIEEMHSQRWKKILSITGKISLLAVFLHLTLMKYPGWIRWLGGDVRQTKELLNPSYPPASLFVFIALLVVLIFRVIISFVGSSAADSSNNTEEETKTISSD